MGGEAESERGERDELRAEETMAVRHLSVGFLAGCALRVLLDVTEEAYGDVGWKSEAAQRAILASTVEYDAALCERRSAKFVRLLLDEVERGGGTPCNALVTRCARGVAIRSVDRVGAAAQIVLCTGKDEALTLRAAPRTGELGLRLWEAGVVMYLCLRRGSLVSSDIEGSSVMELGSGLGLCAHALCIARSRRVVLTDYSAVVLAAMRENVNAIRCALPESQTDIRVQRLDVSDASSAARIAAANSVDTVLVADLCYDPLLTAAMARSLEAIICGHGARRKVVGYIFATRRTEGTDAALRECLSRSALLVEEVPVSIDSRAVKESSFGVLLSCNKAWDLTKVRLYRVT